MEQEIWKDVIGFNGIYEVSNFGNIRSLDRQIHYINGKVCKVKGKPIKTFLDKKSGYVNVVLRKEHNSKGNKVHILVASAFLGHKTTDRTIVVDHINGIKSDNTLSNLRTVTQRENCTTCYTKSTKLKSSKYHGVSFNSKMKKWKSNIYSNGIRYHLGYFDTEIEAHNAYQNKLKEITEL